VRGLSMASERDKVTCYGEKVKLSATELRLLNYLDLNHGRVFSREQLMNNAYSTDVIMMKRNIDVHTLDSQEDW